MELIALGVAIVAALIALILTPLIRSVALKIGFVDRPGERKIHEREIAYGGGIAVALALALTICVGVPIAKMYFIFPRGTEDLSASVLLVLGIGSVGALILGLVDDKIRLSPRVKLLFQLVLAIGAVAGGIRITALIGDTWFMKIVTVMWIVLITNSFNLLDNMDGLCSGIAAIASAMLSLVALQSGQWTYTICLAGVSGASLGFMKYNRSPATIFLGDAGSLFLGFIMACFTALVTYYHYKEQTHLGVGIPILVLAIPLYDTLSVIYIRLKEGRPIMRGDNSHFSHRLVDLGMSRRQAVTTIHLACLAIGLPATVLGKLPEESGFLIIGQAVLVLTIVALLEHAGRSRAGGKSAWQSNAASATTTETSAKKELDRKTLDSPESEHVQKR